MGSRSTPALTEAVAFLRACLAQARESGQPRLASIRELARQAYVSPVTMWKAVALLKDEGEIAACPGRGIRATGTSPTHAYRPYQSSRERWRQVVARIQADIEGGVGYEGVLPPMKALGERYGVCQRTLRKAVRELVSAGRLCVHRKRLRVVTTAHVDRVPTVILLCRGRVERMKLNPDSVDDLRALQRACRTKRLRLRVVFHAFHGRELGPVHAADRRYLETADPRSVWGWMLWTRGFDEGAYPVLFGAMSRFDGPVSVVNHTGADLSPYASVLGRRLRVFAATSDRSAGVTVGRHLRDLGHRRVAYVSPLHAAQWSRERLEGLREAYTDDPRAVVPVCSDELPDKYSREAIAARNERLDRAGERLAAFAESSGDRDMRALTRAYAGMAQLMRLRVSEQAHIPALRPLIERALACEQTTALVFPTDQLALAGLTFLRRRGVHVPRDRSVVGFDDTFDAFLECLTSYSFDRETMIRMAVSHLVGPPLGGPSTGAQTTVLDVFLVSRDTCSSPPVGSCGR